VLFRYNWLLSRYCPEGGTVLDLTAGSFISCFAGKALGLKCIGIEMNDEFYKKAVALGNSFEESPAKDTALNVV